MVKLFVRRLVSLRQEIIPGNVVNHREVLARKSTGSHYTPRALAEFVAQQIVGASDVADPTVLDPAVGDGELLAAMVGALQSAGREARCVVGYDTDRAAVALARQRLTSMVQPEDLRLSNDDFLEVALERWQTASNSLFAPQLSVGHDLVIANPPYVRTQVMGAQMSQRIARSFKLTGRVDLYFAFLLGIASSLNPGGLAGVIVSNRFMTTRAGAAVRHKLRELFDILHVWDLGDTRLFEAAVLPAVLLLRRRLHPAREHVARFTSIYSSRDEVDPTDCSSTIAALQQSGGVRLADGTTFRITQGTLHLPRDTSAVWRLSSKSIDRWLESVEERTHCYFSSVGKIRVGVKTTADKVFIRKNWSEGVELLRPLTTHHIARRFRAHPPIYQILYPHEDVDGARRAVDLRRYPRAAAYLEQHKAALQSREYVIRSGRQWYEVWVPQDPALWGRPKVVFRDIAEKPTFWMDLEGTVVNGDCYWMATTRPENEDMLWLAMAVANSTFIETYYDHKFHNKLYAGRRRFMTQYVAQFPLPDPELPVSQRIVELARALWRSGPDASIEAEVDASVWKVFGVT